MTNYMYIILLYMLVLMGFNFYRAKKVKTQDDFMVAGRSLSMPVMVFTLVCTWIGSGTFIAGAEFAYKAGLSSIWMAAGAWLGILIIYFLAGKIRTFGQYTIGDILEVRYGKAARIFGAIALIISFVTIVSYQLRAGGLILNVATDGAISVNAGQIITALFVITFTAAAGMLAVAYTDLPNGIIILSACLFSLPFLWKFAGGYHTVMNKLPASYFMIINESFGRMPLLKAGGYCLSTFLLLLGIQSMYQKFYSAKTPREAKGAVVFWIIGTIFVEVVVVLIAVFGASIFKSLWEPATVVLITARNAVPPIIGMLLLAAACVVVVSTAMNYLLSPTTNVMRDFYQRFINPNAEQRKMVLLQKICVIIFGILAFIMAVKFKSVLEQAFFAYTIYGVAITPALIAALAWKRATPLAGLISIASGTLIALGLKIFASIRPDLSPEGDPFGIPLIYPSALISILSLIIISYLSAPPSEDKLKIFFPK